MDSTGFFRASLQTGRKVPKNATTSEIPNIIRILTEPNEIALNIAAALIPLTTFLLITAVKTALNPQDSTKQMTITTADSDRKMRNTSAPRAPTARSTPISLRLQETVAEIKLNKSKAENSARMIPTYRKTEDITSNVSLRYDTFFFTLLSD